MRHTAVHALVATTLGIWLSAGPAIGAPAEAPPPTKAASPPTTVMFRGDYKEASARDVILDIAKAAGMSAVIPSDLEGNVTAHLTGVPVMRALALVVGLTNADYRVMDDTIYIIKRTIVVRPPAASGPPRTAESEVERVAREIDAENAALDRAERARSAARAPRTERVETYIHIEKSAPYPPYPSYASPYGWPMAGGVVYAPLGGVNRVEWNPSGITRIPGGHVIPTWHTPIPRF